MAKKNGIVQETEDDREALVEAAHGALKKAKTADHVREVWKEHYLKIGHRILGRLLLGQDINEALRRKKGD